MPDESGKVDVASGRRGGAALLQLLARIVAWWDAPPESGCHHVPGPLLLAPCLAGRLAGSARVSEAARHARLFRPGLSSSSRATCGSGRSARLPDHLAGPRLHIPLFCSPPRIAASDLCGVLTVHVQLPDEGEVAAQQLLSRLVGACLSRGQPVRVLELHPPPAPSGIFCGADHVPAAPSRPIADIAENGSPCCDCASSAAAGRHSAAGGPG